MVLAATVFSYDYFTLLGFIRFGPLVGCARIPRIEFPRGIRRAFSASPASKDFQESETKFEIRITTNRSCLNFR
jgi:hypothetical protein